MREGWTYKKLGEVTTTINGLWTGKKPPFINVAVVRNTNFTKECKLDMTNVAYIDVELKQYNSRKLLPGDIIIEKSGGSDKQPVGRPVLFDIPEGEYSFSNFTSTLRINNADEIIPQFLHCALYSAYLRGETFKLQSKTTGIHNLDFKGYNRLPIPIPSLSEQQSIVAELDKINELISLKKAQLSDLDSLAQSIFYDMFGDPIENEKGWEVKKLEGLVKIIGGYAFKSSDFQENGIPVLRIGNINSGEFKPINMVFWKKDVNLSRYSILPGDMVISLTGTVGKSDYGNICILDNSYEEYYLNQRNAKLEILEKLDKYYLSKVLKFDSIKSKLTNISRGVRQANISNKDIENLQISLPPLTLQQEFAKRIELIEQQKAQISSTIKDLETLLASRMQYWFD